jgi:carboxypeptidase C (cathepsin A)
MQLFVAVLVYVCVYAVCANSDEITSLPGYSEPIKFKQYSGYLQSNATNNRNLFYWFVESQRSPEKDPVLLWLVSEKFT